MTAAVSRLACRGLAVGVAGRTLCAGLDLDVRAGERWAIVGPNGAGKTTLVAMLAGLAGADGRDGCVRRRCIDDARAARASAEARLAAAGQRRFLSRERARNGADRPASASRAFRVGIRGRRRSCARGTRAVRSCRLRGARRADLVGWRTAPGGAGRARCAGAGLHADGRAVVAPRSRAADRRARCAFGARARARHGAGDGAARPPPRVALCRLRDRAGRRPRRRRSLPTTCSPPTRCRAFSAIRSRPSAKDRRGHCCRASSNSLDRPERSQRPPTIDSSPMRLLRAAGIGALSASRLARVRLTSPSRLPRRAMTASWASHRSDVGCHSRSGMRIAPRMRRGHALV